MTLRTGASTVFAFVLALSACAKHAKTPLKTAPWTPGIAYPTPSKEVYRGLLDLRGLIHAHNVASHDACADDGAAADQGAATNQNCFNEFRTDLCAAQHDFVFFTDHGGGEFNSTEYPGSGANAANAAAAKYPTYMQGGNTMLYTQTTDSAYMGQPDQLVARDGEDVANWVTCPNDHRTLLIPGAEGENLMPVGLEHHVAPDTATRTSIYQTNTEGAKGGTVVPDDVDNAIAQEKAAGAVVLMAHPEDMTEKELVQFPIDGFEMYNLHNNALLYKPGFMKVLNLIGNIEGGQTQDVPTNPNLILLGFFMENPDYLSRWAYALSYGAKRVTTMGSDCHQNAIPITMSDGQWGDRYGRVMKWFSNHLLVTPNADGSWDDTNLKAALRAGRLYGAFEVLGYPVGFDYHATVGSTISEMGDEVQLSVHPVLSVKLPTIENLDPSAPKPKFTVRILLADGEKWDEVASGPGDLTFAPTKPGAYRSEIREIPYHLTAALGSAASSYLSHDYVWIYSNAIYVR